MSEPIKVGDLVVVVKPNECGCSTSLGHIFRVDHIQGGPNRCGTCGTAFENPLDAWQQGSDWSAPVFSLKRIPPLGELEGAKQKEDLREPA